MGEGHFRDHSLLMTGGGCGKIIIKKVNTPPICDPQISYLSTSTHVDKTSYYYFFTSHNIEVANLNSNKFPTIIFIQKYNYQGHISYVYNLSHMTIWD